MLPSPKMPRTPALVALAVSTALASSACGPIQYITYITLQASRQVEQAKGLRAEKYAPYEYTAAVENLTKAKELAGHARFQDSVEFGKRARDFAKKAQSVARERANRPDDAPAQLPAAAPGNDAPPPLAPAPGSKK